MVNILKNLKLKNVFKDWLIYKALYDGTWNIHLHINDLKGNWFLCICKGTNLRHGGPFFIRKKWSFWIKGIYGEHGDIFYHKIKHKTIKEKAYTSKRMVCC